MDGFDLDHPDLTTDRFVLERNPELRRHYIRHIYVQLHRWTRFLQSVKNRRESFDDDVRLGRVDPPGRVNAPAPNLYRDSLVQAFLEIG
jgi:hypothetical protein